MEIEVNISHASLADVVAVTYDRYEERLDTTTLGDVVTAAILGEMRSSERWAELVDRFGKAVDAEFRRAAPGYIRELVKAEVTAQLTSIEQGAVTRGDPSTLAQAYVATEVTTQLRAAFAPVVEEALASLRRDLDTAAQETVARFRQGMTQ